MYMDSTWGGGSPVLCCATHLWRVCSVSPVYKCVHSWPHLTALITLLSLCLGVLSLGWTRFCLRVVWSELPLCLLWIFKRFWQRFSFGRHRFLFLLLPLCLCGQSQHVILGFWWPQLVLRHRRRPSTSGSWPRKKFQSLRRTQNPIRSDGTYTHRSNVTINWII